MNPNHKASRLLITGPSGSGKSTLARSTAGRWRARYRFVFDHDHQWAPDPAQSFTACAHDVVTSGACVYDPESQYGSDTQAGFEAFCRFVFDVSCTLEGVKLIVIEELDSFCPARSKLPRSFADVLRLGRRRELDMIAITQKPAGLHPDVRNQLTHVAAFAFTDPLPRWWLRPLGVTDAELDALKPHEFIWKQANAQ